MVDSKTLSEITGIPDSTIRLWQSQGKVPKSTNYKPCIRGICAVLREQLEEARSRKEQSDRLYEEKVIKTRAEAEKLQLEIALKQGELVRVDEVEALWAGYISAAKKRILAIPSKLAYELSGITEPIKIQSRLQEAIDEVLTEISSDEFVLSTADLEEGGETVRPASPSDG